MLGKPKDCCATGSFRLPDLRQPQRDNLSSFTPAGCDEDKDHFEATLAKIAKAKPAPKV
jgi:hypothetical protein